MRELFFIILYPHFTLKGFIFILEVKFLSFLAFIQILFRLEYGWIKKKSCFMETIFSGPSFGVRSNCSEDKSGMWVGSAKNDWNLTSSMKMSLFRVKYGYNIMKNNSRINLWRILYIYIHLGRGQRIHFGELKISLTVFFRYRWLFLVYRRGIR